MTKNLTKIYGKKSTAFTALKDINLTINETITDSELGYTITAKRAIFNVPFDTLYQQESYKSVAVEVEIGNHSDYYNSFSAYGLELQINLWTNNYHCRG